MPEVFVDTSAWVAVADRRERQHEATRASYVENLKAGRRLVTTDLVLAEVHVLLRRRMGYEPAMGFLERVNGSVRVEVLFVTPDLEVAANVLLRQFSDQDFSLTDAVSFSVMRERGIETAMTLDSHFATAGFVVVPSLEPGPARRRLRPGAP